VNKVSDFKIAESLLRALCRKSNVYFVDIPVSFDEDEEICPIHILNSVNIAHTMYAIIDQYIDKSNEIVGCSLFPDEGQESDYKIYLSSLLKTIVYNERSSSYSVEELTLKSLYFNPLVWLILKDIICPINDISPENIKVVLGEDPYTDVARYFPEDNLVSETYSYIFLNEIDNIPVQSAFLLFEAIKAHDLSPVETLQSIFEEDIFEKFMGILNLAFDNQKDIDEFTYTLGNLARLNLDKYRIKQSKAVGLVKTALDDPPAPNQFWLYGLIEGMLEGVRGDDWSVYETLQPYLEEFWNTMEKVKKERKKDGKDPEIPFNTLLRIKSQQTSNPNVDREKTLQSLLSSDRVW
jgi:hypothetical protein